LSQPAADQRRTNFVGIEENDASMEDTDVKIGSLHQLTPFGMECPRGWIFRKLFRCSNIKKVRTSGGVQAPKPELIGRDALNPPRLGQVSRFLPDLGQRAVGR
jgi:hypothetical protein